MNVEEAWDKFSTSSIQKTSVKGMLDTMAAQINEIQQSTARTAELVPKILGDDAAMATAEQEMPQMGMPGMGMDAGGMGMPDMTGGEEPMATEEETPMEEGMPPEEEGMPEEGAEMPEEDMSGEEMPEEDALGGDELAEDEDLLGEDEDLLGEDEDVLADDVGDEISDTDMMGAPEESPVEDAGLSSADDRIKEIAKEMIDEGRIEDAQALLSKIESASDMDMGAPMDDIGEDEEYIEDDEDHIDDDEDFIADDEENIEDDITKSDTPVPDQLSQAGEGPVMASDDECPVKKIDDMIAQLEALKASMLGDAENAPEMEAEVEVVEEPDEEDDDDDERSNDDRNEDIVEEEHIEECGNNQIPTETIGKSAHEVSFRELLEARMNGEDALAPFVKSGTEEITDFSEFDPWGRSKYNMFKKNTQTIADELNDVNSNLKGESGQGGAQLDDVDEEKGMSEGSTEGGDKLDEVTTENPSGTSGQGGDMLDEVSKDDGAKNPQSETEDLLDTVDQKQPTGTSGQGGDMLDDVKKSADMNGKQIKTLKEMIAIRKSGARPDAVSSVGGELERPSLDKITKSSLPEPVRMGVGVDPKKVIERDLAEYNLYKARKTF